MPQILFVVKFQLSSNIITLLEMRMKCGIGKCGRCNVGEKYICKDGPVFSLAELDKLTKEY
ncbi:MAG: iron-sulfur cluster-binding protein [Syntrophales bacterium]